jgi:hypothetical protein
MEIDNSIQSMCDLGQICRHFFTNVLIGLLNGICTDSEFGGKGNEVVNDILDAEILGLSRRADTA